MGKRNKILTGIFIIGCVVIVGIAVIVGNAAKESAADENVMYSGIEIDGVDVGGMTKEEAQAAIDSHIADMEARPVKVIINKNNSVDTTFTELGFRYTGESHIDEAFKVGKSGSFLDRFMGNSKISEEDAKYTLDYTVDKDTVKKFVESKCTAFNVKAKNSRLKFKKNGKFRATRSRMGIEVQVDGTTDKIINAISSNTSGSALEVEAVVKTTAPKYPRKMVAKCKDMIGTYYTSFASSASSRANNVQIAAKYINGTILYPGQVFSTVKVIKDRTEENGYQSAPEYAGGKVVDGIGGGVCQVSTTLYNAVLNAELKVVERSPHSMVVAYVDVSRDAAISGNYKDFKFKNNTDAPVYIWASAEDRILRFKIYGEETRAENRKIEFKSEILETIQPGADVVTEDKSQPSYYRAVTQSAHVGYRAKLWKVIYIDGVEKGKKEVNTSTYNAEPQYVTVGNQGPAVTEAPATERPAWTEEPEETREPEETEVPEEDEKPAVTKKPEPVKKPEPTEKPEPVKKPEPTKKPEPVKKPEPTKKPEPAKKPVVTEEPEPEEEPEEETEPEGLEETGDDEIEDGMEE